MEQNTASNTITTPNKPRTILRSIYTNKDLDKIRLKITKLGIYLYGYGSSLSPSPLPLSPLTNSVLKLLICPRKTAM